MPTLLELQTAMRASVILQDGAAVSAMLAGHIGADRLDIYRNTFIHTLTRALRISFPATERLVGEAFFEGAAQIFIAEHPPRVAWLDQYGGGFANFLHLLPQAKSLAYLSEVAELEWAVNCALHAADVAPLDVVALGAVEPESQGQIRFIADPSIRLMRLEHPVDVIWRAVLASDGDALGKVDLGSGPVNLLVERRATGVAVERVAVESFRFLSALCAGRSIELALDDINDFDCASALAEHLALGRFTGFVLPPRSTAD
jgi:hypothetical protein